MNSKKILWIVAGIIILLVLTSSGWVYNLVRSNSELVQSNELATLQTTFIQQYGSQATIQRLVSPDKVYAAMWTDSNGISHVSWCVGGVWAIVWSSPSSTPSPIP